MKILFVNLPYHGHVIPTIGLMQELVRSGHQVLDYKTVTADMLRETAMAVMEDERIRKNLKTIQAEIARAPGNAGAVGIIEAYYDKQ